MADCFLPACTLTSFSFDTLRIAPHMHTSFLSTGQRSRFKKFIQMQISNNINPRRGRDNQFFLECQYRPRSSTRKGWEHKKAARKNKRWEALSHNVPHIFRELQLHLKVRTSGLILISLSTCSALWVNYAFLKKLDLQIPTL